MNLTHFSLFTGIGGIDLAAEWAGFETVGQVEKNEFCQKILTKHWPDVPGWEDVENVTAESVRERLGDRRIHVLSGGFPCQPFSQAGKREGTEDDRDLWPEMFRVVQELRPTWVLGENVANYTNMGLDRTISDLEGEGYTVRPFEIPAVAVQAPHRRMRVFIVAYSEQYKRERGRKTGRMGGVNESVQRKHFTDSVKQGLEGGGFWSPITNGVEEREKNERTHEIEPPVCGADDGFPDRVDRLRGLGNAVVPQQVYPILRAIAEIERGIRE